MSKEKLKNAKKEIEEVLKRNDLAGIMTIISASDGGLDLGGMMRLGTGWNFFEEHEDGVEVLITNGDIKNKQKIINTIGLPRVLREDMEARGIQLLKIEKAFSRNLKGVNIQKGSHEKF